MHSGQLSRRIPVHVSREGGRSQITAVLRDISQHAVFIGTLHPFLVGSQIEVTPTNRGRSFCLNGHVVQRFVLPAYPGDADFSGMRVEVSLSKEQQREFEIQQRPMKRAALDATSVGFVGNKRHEMTFRNISTSGAALTTESGMLETELVLLTFRLPESNQGLAINCIIVRKETVGKEAQVALEFVDPSDQVVLAIDHYVSSNSA
jgi:hypothetical protein